MMIVVRSASSDAPKEESRNGMVLFKEGGGVRFCCCYVGTQAAKISYKIVEIDPAENQTQSHHILITFPALTTSPQLIHQATIILKSTIDTNSWLLSNIIFIRYFSHWFCFGYPFHFILLPFLSWLTRSVIEAGCLAGLSSKQQPKWSLRRGARTCKKQERGGGGGI